MAYPIPFDAIAEVTFKMTHNDQTVLTVLHYKFIGGPAIADGAATLQALMIKIQAAGQVFRAHTNCTSQDLDYNLIVAQWISPIRYARQDALPGQTIGLVAQPSLPQNDAVALTKGGELAGRHNIGTVHMPGVPTTFVTDGLVTPAGFTAYNDLCTAIQQDVTLVAGQIFRPVIYNRVTPADSKEISTVITQNTSRIMRRRTVGLGI